jgi:hypothetical protein
MEGVSDALATWLREQIETGKRAAGPKVLREGGAWHVDDEDWAWGTGIRDGGSRPVAVCVGGYAAAHIAQNEPLSALARCEAEPSATGWFGAGHCRWDRTLGPNAAAVAIP